MSITKWLPLALLLVAAPSVLAQSATKRTLTLEGAHRALDAALAEARARGTTGAFAVVDDGGHVVAVERLDGTFPMGVTISIGKARTAALFRRPTRVFEEAIGNGRTAMAALADFTPLVGGVPLTVGGEIVGAIGVSGAASAAEDEELALVGAGALAGLAAGATGPAHDVTHIPSALVSSAFEKGDVLLANDRYMVHASHREAPGMAEVHTLDTDIIYVLRGEASFVTGGGVVEGQATVDPTEIRGVAIENGTTRRLTVGDVVVVPNGTPHWFESVSAPFDYYVVKVR